MKIKVLLKRFAFIQVKLIKGWNTKLAFVQYLGNGPMIMEKVVHIPKYVKPWYIYQLILSQLSWNEHSSGSDKIIWYMYQDFTYFGMYHFPQSFWQKTIFYLHINLEYVATEGFKPSIGDTCVFFYGHILKFKDFSPSIMVLNIYCSLYVNHPKLNYFKLF